MRQKFTLLFVLLVFVAAPVFAQSGGVAGSPVWSGIHWARLYPMPRS